MIELMPTMNAALMAACVARLGVGAFCHVYGGVRPAAGAASAGAPVCVILLASTCATVDSLTGNMVFTPTDNEGTNGQIANATAPTWVRFFASNGDICMDMDARLSGDTDTGQEVILTATALLLGAFVRIVGGGFTAA